MFRFPIATLLTGTLLLGTAVGVSYWIVDDQDTGRERYHQLLQLANPINAKVDPTSYTAKQKRTGIHKSFHFTPPHKDTQQELRMFASNSELLLTRGEESEVVEKMEDLRAMIQESLYFVTPEGKESDAIGEGCIPSQKITYLQSETAQCHYTKGVLEASQGEITRFTLSGHSLINTLEEGNISPYQSASAEKVEVRYQDSEIALGGNVSLDYHEGKNLLQLTCDSAILFQENKIPVIEARDKVSLSCNNLYTLTGDFIHFSNGAGYLLRGKERCLLSSKAGDLIRSNRIDLALDPGTIEMENPDGNLYPFEGDPIPLEFTSHRLLWNHKENRLVLYTDVQVSHPTLGHLQNPDVVHIFHSNGKKGADFEKIISEGKTVLTRDDSHTQRYYTLTCEGRVEMNHSSGRMTFVAEDPLNAPVHLKDDFGEIYADRAEIIYTPLQGRIKTPEKVILTGSVKIINKNGLLADSSEVLHMALADKVELTPQSNEIVFYAKRKSRVLFYDKGNDLQISAPKLKVRRDKRTKKESFEGTGDVRFSFQDREIALLREKFTLPLSSQKDEKK